MTTRARGKTDVVLPPHKNAKTHKKVMAELRGMTPEERFQTLVDAGIYDKKGRLRPPYADERAPRHKTEKTKAKTRAQAAKTARAKR
jgi:hypothetical protein